jgi:hypothetical protein
MKSITAAEIDIVMLKVYGMLDNGAVKVEGSEGELRDVTRHAAILVEGLAKLIQKITKSRS